MSDEEYKPTLTPEEAQAHLDRVLDGYQIDYIPRVDLGEDGPRRIPLTSARHAALAVFGALADRKGLDLHELNIDHEVIMEIVDEATDIIGTAFDLGDGPVTVDVARELNTAHAEGKSWQVGHNTATRQFTYLQFDSGVEGTATTHQSEDSLYAAIMGVRTNMGKSE